MPHFTSQLNIPTAIKFRRDSYAVSGIKDFTAEKYLSFLTQLQERAPYGVLQLKNDGDQVIGQIEAEYISDENLLYVYLLYLEGTKRKQGLGGLLHEKCIELAKERGAHRLLLSVSIHNSKAIGFYAALGYRLDSVRSAELVKLQYTI